MLPIALLLVGMAVPAAAFAFPSHSGTRHVLATGIFWWWLLFLGLAWVALVNYSLYARVDGSVLRLFTIRGRRVLDLQKLVRIRSFSLWGQFGGAHALRLYTSDGQHAMVIASMPLAAMNRSNVVREQKLRETLSAHAELADERGRWWLGAGPRPPRMASARHILAMMALYAVAIVLLLVVLVAYLAAALY
jgi:hypothetical protein